MSLDPPLSFTGDSDVVEEANRGFKKLCFLLKQAGEPEPSKLSVADFYYAVDFLEEEAKAASGKPLG
jgi:hypothetical protein